MNGALGAGRYPTKQGGAPCAFPAAPRPYADVGRRCASSRAPAPVTAPPSCVRSANPLVPKPASRKEAPHPRISRDSWDPRNESANRRTRRTTSYDIAAMLRKYVTPLCPLDTDVSRPDRNRAAETRTATAFGARNPGARLDHRPARVRVALCFRWRC